MKRLLALIFFAGIGIGPGYLIYCLLFSGESLGKHTVFTQDVSYITVGGIKSVSIKNTQWNTPIAVDLSPDMNQLAISTSARYFPPTRVGTQSTEYIATLKKGEETVWEEAFKISAKKDNNDQKNTAIKLSRSSGQVIKTFSVNEAGTYQLHVTQQGRNNLVIGDLTVKIRRNVTVPKTAIVVAGFILLIIGIAGLALQQKIQRIKSI